MGSRMIAFANVLGFIILTLCTLVLPSHAEESTLELKEAAFFGGSGDQGSSLVREMGMALQGNRLYLAGVDKTLYGGQALAAAYSLPFGTSPVWAFRWPNKRNSAGSNEEVFADVVATAEGLYVAGWSWSETQDGVGDKEHKAVLAKFPLSGPTSPDAGGALWVAKPNFFRYRGIEGYFAVTSVEEGGSTFIYAAGHAQANGVNNTAILAKYDTNGTLIWSKVLGNTGWFMNSYAWAVTELNGSIYVAGESNYPYTLNNPVATLWKLDRSGNQVWTKNYWQLATTVYRAVDMVALNGYLYLATARRNVPSWGADAMLFQCDEAGNLGVSWAWGREKDDAALGIAANAEGNRLYVVGETSGSRSAGGKDVLLLEFKIDDPTYWWMTSEIVYGGAQDDFARRVSVVGENIYVLGESKSFANGGNAVGQSDVMLLRYAHKSKILPVTIDIKPDGVPNSINPKSHGKIPVAILSTAEFDATALVKTTSVTFGRTGSEPSLAFCNPEDVNGDGLADLVCHFETQQAAFQDGDAEGILKGVTMSGQALRGADTIRLVPGATK